MIHYRSLFDELLAADEDAPLAREPSDAEVTAAARDQAR
jgi:hypothetical protein